MAHEEKYGVRCSDYSAWHRRTSLQRYVGLELATTVHMIDLDAQLWVEFRDHDKIPLALVETALDVGQAIKPTTVLVREARRGADCGEDIPAFCVLYTRSTKRNDADPRCFDIASFRVRQVWPDRWGAWRVMTPQEWADHLCGVRSASSARWDARIEAARKRATGT